MTEEAVRRPWSYITVVAPWTPVPQSTFNALTGTCTEADGTPSGTNEVPDGGFIKTNTTLKTDALVITGGQCERRILGSFYDYQYHHVSPVKVEQLKFGMDPSDNNNWEPGYFNNNYPSFILNSIPGTNPIPIPPYTQNTTAAVSLGVGNEGEHRFRYRTFALKTDCNFPITSPYSEKTLNALVCKPNWKQPGEYGKFPTSQPVQVIYPTSLREPVELVISALNQHLPIGGLRFTTENGENGTYVPADPKYLVVREIFECPIQPHACGCNSHGIPIVDGELQNASYVDIPLVSRQPNTTSTASRSFAIGHEIEHLLGLKDSNQPCSVMNLPPTCGTMADGQKTVPTLSDVLPIIKAIYGNAPKKTCGW